MVDKITLEKAITRIEYAVKYNEDHKGTYFWKSPSVASQRRYMEKKHSYTEHFIFTDKSKKPRTFNVKIAFKMDVSVHYVYFAKEFTVNGHKFNFNKAKAFAKKLNERKVISEKYIPK